MGEGLKDGRELMHEDPSSSGILHGGPSKERGLAKSCSRKRVRAGAVRLPSGRTGSCGRAPKKIKLAALT